jgi:UDP-3-O-[3-hydroxymyristoyl] glucosamine N-acyltransferase
MKLKEIGNLVEGAVYGYQDMEVATVLPPDEAQEGDLTFLFDRSVQTKAGAVVSSMQVKGKSGIIVDDTKEAMYRLLKSLARVEKPRGISPKADIEDGAQLPESCTVEAFATIGKNTIIGENVYIGAHSYVDRDVLIGDNCHIHPNVVIYAHTQLGTFVVVGANSVIGKEGFGYIKHDKYERIRHVGGVLVERYVDLGSNVTVDRGTIGNTIIGEGTKVDNQVHIAHNVRIGKNCLIMGQSGIAGSSRIGNNVVICGQVGISDHLQVEDDVIVYAKSGVFKSLERGRKYSGTPAREHGAVLRAIARLYGRNRLGP